MHKRHGLVIELALTLEVFNFERKLGVVVKAHA